MQPDLARGISVVGLDNYRPIFALVTDEATVFEPTEYIPTSLRHIECLDEPALAKAEIQVIGKEVGDVLTVSILVRKANRE
ncbi:hypothetical protein [Haloarcula onubensis]|uniref:Uncharacterized protein n=1 Tax=Haloarcula onubensis TaxID=2950539 RepID=A0ABU2FTG0_9EURY|nr:hypothetical protein [Halomicroarcula sp. S3CR25-11]MDS0284053.1 hypothetical protein [Halomicroarcula sp. S3CR25-11]